MSALSDTKDAIHWALIRQRREIRAREIGSDFEGMQALHCPFYAPLMGHWGADWGAIMHPRSEKFGQLVFEHEWCGCPSHP